MRREVWREAYSEAAQLAREHPRGKGRPKADDAETAMVKAAKTKAEAIKNSAYALGKAPEHLTENQRAKVAVIAENNKRLYRAYRMKEMLRLLLKIRDVEEAATELKRWLWWTGHSRIKAFKELYLKIKRHREHILNAIRFGMSNARIEATNNKIKLIVRKAYGFRNIQNMLDMVYLVDIFQYLWDIFLIILSKFIVLLYTLNDLKYITLKTTFYASGLIYPSPTYSHSPIQHCSV